MAVDNLIIDFIKYLRDEKHKELSKTKSKYETINFEMNPVMDMEVIKSTISSFSDEELYAISNTCNQLYQHYIEKLHKNNNSRKYMSTEEEIDKFEESIAPIKLQNIWSDKQKKSFVDVLRKMQAENRYAIKTTNLSYIINAVVDELSHRSLKEKMEVDFLDIMNSLEVQYYCKKHVIIIIVGILILNNVIVEIVKHINLDNMSSLLLGVIMNLLLPIASGIVLLILSNKFNKQG